MKSPHYRNENIVDALLLAGITAFLMVYFDVRYLFFDTVVTGGDTASWQAVAQHLARELLPRGRLTGWDMGNFCGYPNFSFYFLPPFLLAALPAMLFNIPLTITLKWAIMSGIYLFPAAVYAGLRRMQYRFPVPVMGAGGALLILFNETYTMFGGNALSTFAGEFCYMFAFGLLALFIGHYYAGEKTLTRATGNGILLGLIGLSHLFVFIPAVITLPAICLITGRIRYPLKVGLTAAAMMAFWLLPLISYRHPYTTPVYMIWQEFVTLRHVMAGILIIVMLIGPRLALTGLGRRNEKSTVASAVAVPLVFALGVLALVYLSGRYLALGSGLFYNRLTIPDYSGSPILIREAARVLDAFVLPLAVAAGMAAAFFGIKACCSGSGEKDRQAFYHRAGSASLLMLTLSGVWGFYLIIARSAADESIWRFFLNAWIWRTAAAAVAAALGAVLFFSKRFRDRLLQAADTVSDERFAIWLALIAGSLVIYFSAHFLKVPDIRFLPPALYALMIILMAETPGPFMADSRMAVKVLGALTVVYLAIMAAVFGAQKADLWFRYNNRGYELTGGYEDFKALNQYLRTSYPDRDPLNAPRVAYEKCNLYGPYGGDRAFESLPYFSGRQTLEGIHYAGSLASRSIAFLQTEFSQEVKTPAALILSRMNPAVLPAHFDLYNISQVVVMTKNATQALSASPYFKAEASFGGIKLFRYTRSRERYVDVPAVRPVLYRGSRWADDFFSLFKDRTDVLLVPQQFVTDRDDRAVLGGMTDSFRDPDPYRLNQLDRTGIEIETRLSHHEIRFKTNRVGLPHIIKVSYFPNWKVRGARGVYPLSPHFMLVIPRAPEVVLTYGRTGWDIAGIGITWGWMVMLLGAGILRFGGWTLSGGGRLFFQPVCRFDAGLDRLESNFRYRRRGMAGMLIVVSIGIAVSGAVLRNRPVRIYETGYRAFQEGAALAAQHRTEAAARQFQRGIDSMAPLLDRRARVDHRDVIHSMIVTAMCWENLGNLGKAQYWYERIIAEYPYSRFVGESHVRMARLCRQQAAPLLEMAGSELRRGHAAAAQRFFREGTAQVSQSLTHYAMAVQEDPYSTWTDDARQDLAGFRRYLQEVDRSLPAGREDAGSRHQMASIKARLEQIVSLIDSHH